MVYQSQSWVDDSSLTPLSAARLNHLETQYAAAITEVISEIGTPTSAIYSALNAQFATNNELTSVSAASFFNYGLRPIIRYTGTSWPSRVASIPSAYAGNVDYDSADFTGVPSPSDMIANDRWIRQTT